MVRSLPLHGWNGLAGALQLALLFIALQDESGALRPHALAAMAGVGLCGWGAAYQRYRQMRDLPTSRIASAAQGYVELFGRSELLPGEPVLSKLTGLPCCWYRYYVERRGSDDRWYYEDSGTSVHHFLLVDETGRCVVSPEGAEVVSHRRHSWTRGDYRYTEWLLLPQGPLYALGEFRTVGGADAALDERADTGALLAEWKREKRALFERFDLDRDGRLDLREWELARFAARREVRRRHAELRAREGVHLLARPADGRPFVLANVLPEALGRRFLLWGWVHLAVFFAAGAASALLLS